MSKGRAPDSCDDPREAGRQALFEIIDDGFCIIQFIDGPDGPLSDYRHIEANSGYERHTGIKGIVGKTVFDVAPEDGREWVKIYGAVLETGVPIRFERNFAEAGRFIEVSARRLDPASLGQVAVLFRDITGRKQAEAEIRASEKISRENEQRVSLALEAGAIVGTWVWDVPQDAFTVDEGLSTAMGLGAGSELGDLKLSDIIQNVHPEDTTRLTADIEAALREGGAYFQQFRVLREDRKYHWIEASGKVELNAQGKPTTFSGVLMDVSGRREIEAERDRVTAELFRLNETLERRVTEQTAELMAKEEELRHAQKMEAVGQLTGGLAHDFNNLLAAVSGAVEMAQARLAERRIDEIGRYLAAAKSASTRAANLTQRLMAFARKQTLAPKPTDVGHLCEGMVELVQRTVGPHIELHTTAEAGAWLSLVDQSQLENALLNLCINARDAMPEGGHLGIRVENDVVTGARARTLGIASGDYLQVSVADTGSGMSREQIDRAFEPFFTTKPMGEGTGLGLSMVYGFAQQSGGAANIRSEPGKGTTVTLYLPRSRLPAEESRTETASVEATPHTDAGRTVLVVEDEILVRMVVADALRDRGYRVLEAGTAAEALQVLAEAGEVDVLLTDVGLPRGMNGRQLAEAARAARPGLKVVFVTGYDEGATLGRVPPASEIEVVQKPFDLEVLMAKVRDLVVPTG
ncbi:ATP-binding protein [Salipiger mangrovisoli]|uniref:histidine kinase n=1 Tax=Salipiger mangrovisoli TaxID=2865933 RepID=A0ABR9X4I1_9RHOB|nr:ATP-binding protein [Salipiger mangrovisoli]MBE9638464.1 response regulator [Salipiger mangrovisoli]